MASGPFCRSPTGQDAQVASRSSGISCSANPTLQRTQTTRDEALFHRYCAISVYPLSTNVVAKFEAFLQDNLDRHVSVEEMARYVRKSRHHSCRRLKAATSKSPYQFAIQGKLLFAFSAIKEEETTSILSIAQRLGYDSPSQFSKRFEKYFGFWQRLRRTKRRACL